MNGDGKVNAKDIVAVAKQLGRHRPYNAKYDVNEDGKVNVHDLLAVIGCYIIEKHDRHHDNGRGDDD